MTTFNTNTTALELFKEMKMNTGSGKAVPFRVYRKARSFAELVDLVRTAEQKFIAGGITDVETHIAMLRGIYYGTPWSMDYAVEKSDTRNIGFQTYTSSGMPDDPRPVLGTGLFTALYHSAEVKDGNRIFDFGHASIGMHARASIIARSVPLPSGGTGLESSTWLGDLGGGAGMLAFRRIGNPNLRAKTVFTNSHDYGAPANLEGDIGGFLIGNAAAADPGSLSLSINNGGLAEALRAYLERAGTSWKERVRHFLGKYGAVFTPGNELTNKDAVVETFATKIVLFGAFYMTVRMKDRGMLSTNNLAGVTQRIGGASHEVATIFVEALMSSLKSGSDRLVCVSDPPPTPPAAFFEGWKLFRDAFDVIDNIIH